MTSLKVIARELGQMNTRLADLRLEVLRLNRQESARKRVAMPLPCRKCGRSIVFVTRPNAKFYGHAFYPATAIHEADYTVERFGELRKPSDTLRYRLRVRLEKSCKMEGGL